MAAYLIVQIRLLAERTAFTPYREVVGPLAQKFGGRYLVAGGAAVETLEGSHDGRSLVIFEFPSMEAIHAFWNAPEYAHAKTLRDGIAELDVWAVLGFVPGSP